MSRKRRSNLAPAKGGRPPVHGAYSLIVRDAKGTAFPERARALRRYLSDVRAGMIRDLGPTEADLTTGQLVLIDRCLSKLAVLRHIEEHVREHGVFEGNKLTSVLGENYIAFSNSLRLTLRELGVKIRKADEAIDLSDYIRSKDAGRSVNAEKALTAVKENGDNTEKGE